MKRLSKADAKQLEVLSQAYAEAANVYNACRGAESARKLNAIRDEVNVFRQRIYACQEAYYEGRPERWQESSAGGEYRSWMEGWAYGVGDAVDADHGEAEPDEVQLLVQDIDFC